MNKNIKILSKILIITLLLLSAFIGREVFATSLENTTLVTGTQNLVEAIRDWIIGIGVTICGGYFIYYVYCLKTNDEGERRRNIQNIKTTLIAIVLITCGLAVIDTILSFYK